jgi:flagellar biosynthetic protein FlhB
MAGLRETARRVLGFAFHAELTPASVQELFRSAVLPSLLLMLCAAMVVSTAAAGVHLASTRLGIAAAKLAPDFRRLNPIDKLRNLPRQNFPSFVRALALLPVFLALVWLIVDRNLPVFLALPLSSVDAGLRLLFSSLQDLLWKAAAVFFVVGTVDLIRQFRLHKKDLRMTKQEVREELKEVEGNPLVKMRIRRIQRDLLRRRMMQQVPKATAIIVNPTHFAVAIRYELHSMAAPTVVAKGKNYLAQRIRQKAVDHQVPIIENPPLAQALYKSVAVGQEIPAHLYRAVAEILAYIYKLMNGRLPG